MLFDKGATGGLLMLPGGSGSGGEGAPPRRRALALVNTHTQSDFWGSGAACVHARVHVPAILTLSNLTSPPPCIAAPRRTAALAPSSSSRFEAYWATCAPPHRPPTCSSPAR